MHARAVYWLRYILHVHQNEVDRPRIINDEPFISMDNMRVIFFFSFFYLSRVSTLHRFNTTTILHTYVYTHDIVWWRKQKISRCSSTIARRRRP